MSDFDYPDDQYTPRRAVALFLLWLVQWGAVGAWFALLVNVIIIAFSH